MASRLVAAAAAAASSSASLLARRISRRGHAGSSGTNIRTHFFPLPRCRNRTQQLSGLLIDRAPSLAIRSVLRDRLGPMLSDWSWIRMNWCLVVKRGNMSLPRLACLLIPSPFVLARSRLPWEGEHVGGSDEPSEMEAISREYPKENLI